MKPTKLSDSPALDFGSQLQQAMQALQAGQLSQSLSLLQALRQAAPDDANVLHLSALAYKRQGDYPLAIKAFERLVDVHADAAFLGLVLSNFGNCLREAGLLPYAESILQRAVHRQPDLADAWNNLGAVLEAQGKQHQAIPVLQSALALNPQSADAHNNLGGAYLKTHQLDPAKRHLEQALALAPTHADAWYNLGNLLADIGELDRAIAAYQQALIARPDYVEARISLIRQLQNVCDWAALVEHLNWVRQRVTERPDGRVFPFAFIGLESTADEQFACAQAWADRHYRRDAQPICGTNITNGSADPGQRLRLGYLSSDFHDHATAWLMAEVFELHDRSRFEVFGYSAGPYDGGPMRQRLARAFEHFVDVSALGPQQMAQRIAADQLHLLIDLKGYTRDTRSAVLPWRPAPILVNYLGYPGTLGDGMADYILADATIIPPGAEHGYGEQVIRLPRCYQPNDRHRVIAPMPSRREVGLPDQALVYACFNHTYKITGEVFARWMSILRGVEGSVLWLLRSNRWAEQALRTAADRAGVDPQRLVFGEPKPLAEHLGRLAQADLFLDTAPVNAHTSASDALWAGVPVLTCPGQTFISRVAASLVQAAELPAHLIAASWDQYVTTAIALGRQPLTLALMKQHLQQRRTHLPLFDTPAFVADLETCWRQLVEAHRPVTTAGLVVGAFKAAPAAVALAAPERPAGAAAGVAGLVAGLADDAVIR